MSCPPYSRVLFIAIVNVSKIRIQRIKKYPKYLDLIRESTSRLSKPDIDGSNWQEQNLRFIQLTKLLEKRGGNAYSDLNRVLMDLNI